MGRIVATVEQLQGLRDRVMPMMAQVAEDYRDRTPEGYPVITDAPGEGVVGIEIDPSFGLFLTTDGTGLFVDLYTRSHRIDARASASREKFAGRPVEDHRSISADTSDNELRNLLAELLSRFNMQPLLIHITDTD